MDAAPFDPSDLVQDVAELLAPRAHAAGLDIAAIVDPDLAERLVGDVSRLRQILFNLAGNAIKFTTEGGVLIEARRGQGGEGLELVVRDTGVGVPEHAKAKLFEAFSQVNAADARRDGGVGLGLAIARGCRGDEGKVRDPAFGHGAMSGRVPLVQRPLGVGAPVAGALRGDKLPPVSALAYRRAGGGGARLTQLMPISSSRCGPPPARSRRLHADARTPAVLRRAIVPASNSSARWGYRSGQRGVHRPSVSGHAGGRLTGPPKAVKPGARESRCRRRQRRRALLARSALRSRVSVTEPALSAGKVVRHHHLHGYPHACDGWAERYAASGALGTAAERHIVALTADTILISNRAKAALPTRRKTD
jgi:hypothetical protein